MRITKRNNNEIEIDLLALFRLLWSKKVFIILSAVLGGALVLVATLVFVKPQYTASVYMYANNSNSSDTSKSISSSDLTASAKLVNTYSAIITRDAVLDQVITETGTKYTAKQLRSRITIKAVNDTEVFMVSVQCDSPEEAMTIANSIAGVAIVRISEIIDGCSTKIVDEAKVPNGRSSPSYKKNTVLGAALGICLSIGFLLVSALIDNTINEESDFKAFEYPVLGNIPEFNSVNNA